MAKADDLELSDGQAGGSKKKLMIIIAGVVLLLLIGGGVAAWLLMGGEDEAEADAKVEKAAEQEKPAAAEQGPATYQALDPVFVVNLPGKTKLLQVGIQVRFYAAGLAEFLKHNDPMIRHTLLNLIGQQDASVLQTRDGKEQLRAALKIELNQIVTKLKGPGEVDELFFSSFVMQ